MKKILLFVLLFYIAGLRAQWIDRPADAGFSFISTEGSTGVGIYAADAFSMGLDFIPTEITFYGKRTGTAPIADLIQSFNIIFFNNVESLPHGYPNLPNSAKYELRNIDLQYVNIQEDENSTNFTIDIAALTNRDFFIGFDEILWISGFPTVSGHATQEGRWNWFGSQEYAEFPPLVYDPHNLLNLYLNGWTPIEEISNNTRPSLAWTMVGEHGDPVSIEDLAKNQIRIFPNPVKDEITLLTPAGTIASDIEINDMQGRKLKIEGTGGKINVSHLPSGFYLIRFRCNGHAIIRKILKE